MIHARRDYNDRIIDKENKIPEPEPVFLLRAQDKTAAQVVRFWAQLNAQLLDGDQYACELAMLHATKMDEWPVKKTATVPKKENA